LIVSTPDGSATTLSYIVSAESTDASQVYIKPDLSGDYVIQLVVTDSKGLESESDLVFVSTKNSAPKADAGTDQTAQTNDLVTLDGGGSSDVDGDSLTYSWSLITVPDGSGTLVSDPTAVNPSFVVDVSGTYVAQLIVNDGTVDSAPDTVTINWENSAPVANAGPDQTSIVGTEVTFDGSDSFDIDDGIKAYDWDFGDQTRGSGIMATHVYSTAGTYTVTLTVTDNSNETSTDTAQVAIKEQSTLVIHVADIAMSLKKAGPNVNAIATVLVIDNSDPSTPIDGVTVFGHWSGLTNDSDSEITDESGTVSLKSDRLKNGSGTFIFIIDNIIKDGWTYDPNANVEASDSITSQLEAVF
jgi:PKD repeat protein